MCLRVGLTSPPLCAGGPELGQAEQHRGGAAEVCHAAAAAGGRW